MKCQRCLTEKDLRECYYVSFKPSGAMTEEARGQKFYDFTGYFCAPCVDDVMASIQKNRLLATPKAESEVVR